MRPARTHPDCGDYEPFALGRRFLVVPPGHAAAAPQPPGEEGDGAGADRMPLIMPRGAFGSGEHETTASCVEILETLPEVAGARILDLGSGTGILSVAALKLGAAFATLVDTDARAVAAGRQACELNGVGDRVRHVHGTLGDSEAATVDLAIANLYGHLLLQLGGDLAARVQEGGLVLLSGIAWEHRFDVEQLFCGLGCNVARHVMLDDYCSYLFRRLA